LFFPDAVAYSNVHYMDKTQAPSGWTTWLVSVVSIILHHADMTLTKLTVAIMKMLVSTVIQHVCNFPCVPYSNAYLYIHLIVN